MKLCTACVHCRRVDYPQTSNPYHVCMRFGPPEQWVTIDPVTGANVEHRGPVREPYCRTERAPGWLAAR